MKSRSLSSEMVRIAAGIGAWRCSSFRMGDDGGIIAYSRGRVYAAKSSDFSNVQNRLCCLLKAE